MATLVAIKFPTTEGAQTMLYTVENSAKTAVDPDPGWSHRHMA